MLRMLSAFLTFLVVAAVGFGWLGRHSAELSKADDLTDAQFFRKDRPNDGWIIVGDLEVRFPAEFKPQADQKRHRHDDGLQDWRPNNEWAYGVDVNVDTLPGDTNKLWRMHIKQRQNSALSVDFLCRYRTRLQNMIIELNTYDPNMLFSKKNYIDHQYVQISKNDRLFMNRPALIGSHIMQMRRSMDFPLINRDRFSIVAALSENVIVFVWFLLEDANDVALADFVKSLDAALRSHIRRRDRGPWPIGQDLDKACALQNVPASDNALGDPP